MKIFLLIFFPLKIQISENCIVTEVKRPLHAPISLPVYVRVFFCALYSCYHSHTDTDTHTHPLVSDMLFSSNVS